MIREVIPPRGLKCPTTFIRLRPARRHELVEDGIDRMLVIDPAVAVADEIELQALQLEAGRVGDVLDDDRPEIGLARLGADGREFRVGDLDLVVAARELVGERFHQGGHVDSSGMLAESGAGRGGVPPPPRESAPLNSHCKPFVPPAGSRSRHRTRLGAAASRGPIEDHVPFMNFPASGSH